MKNESLASFVIAASAALLLTVVPAATYAAERLEHKELPAKAGGTLNFKAVAGSLEIKTHDRDNVRYEAAIKPGRAGGDADRLLEDLQFDYENADGDVTITMRWKNDQAPRNVSINARHTLVIPSRYNLVARTAGGPIRGDGIGGKVTAQTAGGDIRFGKVDGDLVARTAGGNVAIDAIKGDVEIKTSGGNIQVGAVQGSVLGKTSGGSINAELAPAADQPLDLSTSGGNIKLAVPGDFKADLDARTSGGNVSCDLPVTGEVKRSAVNGKINGGGPKVTLKTSGGNIRVATK